MSVTMRRMVEREVVTAAVKGLLAAGYRVSVDYERGSDTVVTSLKEPEIIAALFACDEEWLLVTRDGEVKPCGWVYLVYGNDGWDVISDYTTNLETALSNAFNVSKEYE